MRFLIILLTAVTSLFGADFTVSSYNCGGLSDHYDYIRAVGMQKLMKEREAAELENLAKLERIQSVALKILFSPDQAEKELARKEWVNGGYSAFYDTITSSPLESGSVNTLWHQKSDEILTRYNVRPILIHDQEVAQTLQNQIDDLTKGLNQGSLNDQLDITRTIMAKKIFQNHLQHDIIALQEADYLDRSVFPSHYDVRFADSEDSINGLAWNRDRFELLDEIGDIRGRGFILLVRDLTSNETVAIASAHLTGCNPFSPSQDSATGDAELLEIIARLEQVNADIYVIAMDSNVTAMHPRMKLLKEAGFILDYKNHLEPTCTSPWQIVNNRIDWIAIRSKNRSMKISNMAVSGVGLNHPQNNISDHLPIAAKISSDQ